MKSPPMVRRAAVIGALVTLALAPAGLAQPTADARIMVHDAWSRPANIGVNAAGYLSITNAGRFADRLMSAQSPIAATVSLHQSQTLGGVTTMRGVDGIPVRAGQTVVLAPGGYHLMLEGVTRPLRVGDRVPVALTFVKAGVVRTELVVRATAPQSMPDMKM